MVKLFIPVAIAIVGSLLMIWAKKENTSLSGSIFKYIRTNMKGWGWIGVAMICAGLAWVVVRLIYAWIINPLK